MTPVSASPWQLELVHPWFAGEVAWLTYPAYRHVLRMERGIGVVARAGGVPVGLIVGEMVGDTGHVLSLFVVEGERRRGLGKLLIQRLEACALERGAGRMRAVYMVEEGTPVPPIRRFLEGVGFKAAVPRMLVLRSQTQRMLEARWTRSALCDGYCMKAWAAVTEQEREELRLWQERTPWIPADVLPFVHEKGCDPSLSFALLTGGRVVGWMLNHRMNKDTLRMTCSYMDPGLQRAGRLVAVYAAVVRALPAAGVKEGTWAVPLSHPRMVQFTMRHFARYCSYVGESFSQTKLLAQ